MTDNSLRTALARAIHDGPNAQAQYRAAGIEPHPFGECAYTDQYLADADAVLAVLADLPGDVIERATEALRQDSYAVACPPWDSLDEEHKAGWLARGRLTLRAAFGGEQNDG